MLDHLLGFDWCCQWFEAEVSSGVGGRGVSFD